MRAIAVLLLVTACGAPTFEPSGEALFRQPLVDGNTFACATCHARSPNETDVRRVAHPLAGAARRPHFKNGEVATFREAVNTCVTEWQGSTAWATNDARFEALEAFLATQPPTAASAITFDIIEPPAQLGGGDASRGQAFFNASCSECHGADGRGDLRGPNLAGAMLAPEYVAQRIRKSGSASSGTYPGLTGGRMPFWSKQRLDDGELRDLVAYVSTAGVPDAGLYVPDAGTPDPTGSCAKTHAKVGWYTDLSTYAHGVKGRATVTDDCTVTLSGFHYDGNGIDVRLFGALGKDFARGFPLGGQLYRPGQPWVNVTLPMRLPAGKSLDDLDSVSVWCVAARHNFGDGTFRAP